MVRTSYIDIQQRLRIIDAQHDIVYTVQYTFQTSSTDKRFVSRVLIYRSDFVYRYTVRTSCIHRQLKLRVYGSDFLY